MQEKICTEKKYSTTRLLVKERPVPEKKPEDKFETILFLTKNEDRKDEGGLRTKGYFKKSYENKPLISIITVVFNGEKYLEQTIQSVINQSYDNVEYIIIDGGSSDGTVDIIKKYEEQIDYWVSESDEGIYDAMNKGFILSTGEVFGIINADDWYEKYALEKSIKKLSQSLDNYVTGAVIRVPSGIEVKPKYPLNSRTYQGMMYPHIGGFISKQIYKTIGLFDLQYRVSSDFDMAMRIHLHGYKSLYLDMVVGQVREGGVSAGNESKKENMNIAIKYGRHYIIAKILYYIYVLKTKIKSFL